MTNPEITIHNHVNHPKHYNSHPSGIECITIVEHFSFNIGNAIKYIWRAGLKYGNKASKYKQIQQSKYDDLCKAEWYIHREILKLEKEMAEG